MEKQLHVLGGGGGTLQQTRGTHRHCAYASTQSQRAAGLCIKINDHNNTTTFTTVLETIRDRPVGANDTRTVPLKFMVPS
jgi:hypothetical protein